MRKGISPVIATVLLIAIAVIAAVGLFFWVSGIAGKQPTSDKPHTITAQCIPDYVTSNQTDNWTVGGSVVITDNSPQYYTPLTNVTLLNTANQSAECLERTLTPGLSISCNSSEMQTSPGTHAIIRSSNTRLISTAEYTC